MNSVIRSFEILELVADNQETGLGFPEIVERLQYPNSSAFRLLKQLVDLNYLTFDEGTRRYHVSFRLARIGACVTGSLSLTKVGRPFLRKLFEESGHTCNMGILGKDCGVYVDVFITTRYGVKLLSEIGRDFPLHCTALGKVLLADMDARKRALLLPENLPAFTEASITDRNELERQLLEVAAQGFAVDREEVNQGLTCIAAPVFDSGGRVMAAVSVSCPSFACRDDDQDRLRTQVMACGLAISKVFGYRAEAG